MPSTYKRHHTRAHELLERWRSIVDIIHDPHGRDLATLQEMRYEDWLNFQIKNFVIRKLVLNYVCTIIIDGKEVQLINPHTQLPLLYGDIISDRSGPMFGGYLHDAPATEYLTTKPEAEAVKAHLRSGLSRTIHERQQALGGAAEVIPFKPLDDDTIGIALSIFDRKHTSQRVLSDFDLTAHELSLFSTAVYNAVKAHLALSSDEDRLLRKLDVSPAIQRAIGETLWTHGSTVQTSVLKHVMELPSPTAEDYERAVRAHLVHPSDPIATDALAKQEIPSHKKFTHILIETVGKHVQEAYREFYTHIGHEPSRFFDRDSAGEPDTYYGLGIPLNEAPIKSVDADGKVELSLAEEDMEIGDVITDHVSCWGSLLNEHAAFKRAQIRLSQSSHIKVLFDTIFAEKIAHNQEHHILEYQHDIFSYVLETLSKDDSLSADEQKQVDTIVSDYYQQLEFLETARVFEEAGNKEGQSVWFKANGKDSKLIGNISDTGPFLHRAVAQSVKSDADGQRSKAHLQITQLSTLISVLRWGIYQDNHATVGNTHLDVGSDKHAITAIAFAESINSRSYGTGNCAGGRRRLGWSHISEDDAQQRIEEYQQGFEPVWAFVKKQDDFYRTTTKLKQAMKEVQLAKFNEAGDLLKIATLERNVKLMQAELRQELLRLMYEELPELTSYLTSISKDHSPDNAVNNILYPINLKMQVLEFENYQ